MYRRVLLPALLLSGPLCIAQTPAAVGTPAPTGIPHAGAAGSSQRSMSLEVDVPGHPAQHFTLADLQLLPQTSVTVHNAHTQHEETYAGPLVADLLTKAGWLLTKETRHTILDAYVTATGTDGYTVLYSGAEMEPALHKAQPIVALTEAGQPLTATGAFQLIDPADILPARWVRNLDVLTVVVIAKAAEQQAPDTAAR